MVSSGPRPSHRRGTTGRKWVRFRSRHVDAATHCANPTCGKVLRRDMPCTHPRHQHLNGCPTHPDYPTLQHPDSLIQGGHPRDDANAEVWCYYCNSSEGAHLRRARSTPAPLLW